MRPFIAAFLAVVVAAACNNEITGLEPPSDPRTEVFAASLGVDISQMQVQSGVYYKDIVVGSGPAVSATTDSVRINYAGYLKDGKLFESGTNTLASPLNFIQGFRLGVMGMKEGGKRKLVVPSELGYGGHSIRNQDLTIKIPRQSTLIFDVEALKVYNPK